MAEIRNPFTIPIPNATQKTQKTTLSLSEDSATQRRMLYLQNDYRAAVTVSNYLISSFASLIKLPTHVSDENYDSGGPYALEFFANGAAPLDPFAGVDSNDTTSDLFLRSYTYEISGYDTQYRQRTPCDDVRKIADFDIRSV